MLKFSIFKDIQSAQQEDLHLDPHAVTSVVETERRIAYGGWHSVAVITMITGKEFVVTDYGRKVAERIMTARQQHREELGE